MLLDKSLYLTDKQQDMEIDFKHESKIRVRYGETDQMGYCYYGNYAQFFEVGRVDALRQFGMSYKEMEQEGIMLPVSDFQVKYFAPAFYDDELTIVTKLVSLNGVRLEFHYDVINPAGKCISRASTVLVFVDRKTMRPTHPPVRFTEIMKKYEKSI